MFMATKCGLGGLGRLDIPSRSSSFDAREAINVKRMGQRRDVGGEQHWVVL